MPFQKKATSVIEPVNAGPGDQPVGENKTDRRDKVRIGDSGIVWRSPGSSMSDKPLPALVLSVGGRRTLSLYVFSDSGTRIVRGARHWTDPDFDNTNIDTSQLSSWSFNDE